MSSKRFKYCIVPMCTNTTIKAPEKLFFDVPRNEVERKKWCYAMKRDTKKNPVLSTTSVRNVCQDHFDLELDTENYLQHRLQKTKLRLKKGTVPHIFACQKDKTCAQVTSTERAARRQRKKIVEDLLKNFDPSTSDISGIVENKSGNMPRSCSFPGCRNGTRKDISKRKLLGIRKASLFLAPKKVELRYEWSKAISADKVLSASDVICEDHFNENDILRSFETKLPNECISKIDREKPRLKANAIPVFSSPSSSISSINDNHFKEREPFSQGNHDAQCSIKIKLENEPVSDHNNVLTFSELSQNLTFLQKPCKMWGVSDHEDTIICARWTEKFVVQKIIVLDVNLKYKVFLHGAEFIDINYGDLNCIADVEKILERVEEL